MVYAINLKTEVRRHESEKHNRRLTTDIAFDDNTKTGNGAIFQNSNGLLMGSQ
jgi:hypothetical protein